MNAVAGVTIVAIRSRRLDVMGSLVLAGIALGTVLGLASHSPRLVLVEGSVPTGVFGVACLGSLWGSRRPLMLSLFRELIGPDTPRGREMARLWHDEPAFRRDIRVITAAWGAGFLVEAALRVIIVYNVSTGTALAISKVTPFLFGGVMSAWTLLYGAYRKRQSVRIATARAAQAARSSQDQPT